MVRPPPTQGLQWNRTIESRPYAKENRNVRTNPIPPTTYPHSGFDSQIPFRAPAFARPHPGLARHRGFPNRTQTRPIQQIPGDLFAKSKIPLPSHPGQKRENCQQPSFFQCLTPLLGSFSAYACTATPANGPAAGTPPNTNLQNEPRPGPTLRTEMAYLPNRRAPHHLFDPSIQISVDSCNRLRYSLPNPYEEATWPS